jgi:hypothetical protein
VQGSLQLNSTTLTKAQVEQGVQKSLAQQMNVSESAVNVTATESRRLNSLQAERRLAGVWTVVFTVQIPTSQVTAATSKVNEITADPTNFNQVLKTSLISLGVSDADATVSVTNFNGNVQTPTIVTTSPLPGSEASSSVPTSHLTFFVFSVVAHAMRR